MFCSKCGTPNDDAAQFCSKCGAGFNKETAGPIVETKPKKRSIKKIILIIVISIIAILVLLMIIGGIMMMNGHEGGATQIEIVSSSNPSPTTTQPETSMTTVENPYPGEVLYKGLPVFSFFNNGFYDVRDLIGAPLEEDVIDPASTLSNYGYEGMQIFAYAQTGELTSIGVGDPSVLSVDGITLDKNRAEIIEIFGDPAGEWDDRGYGLVYYFDNLEMHVLMESHDGKALEIMIKPSDGFGDRNNYSDESGSWREEYFTDISYNDLIRYPDNHIGDKVHFVQMTVTQIVQPKYYIASWDNDRYFIIDDRGNDTPNANIGEAITVYGRFDGIQTALVAQSPIILSDHLIINNMKPDPMEFAEALVATLNCYNRSYSNGGNSYLGGDQVSLVCLFGDQNGVPTMLTPYNMNRSSNDGNIVTLYVDGYNIFMMGVRFEGQQFDKYIDLSSLSIQMKSETLYRVEGEIEFNNSTVYGNVILLHADSIEPY